MNSSFKAWLIKDSDKWDPVQKRNFLRMAKFEPDRVVQILSANLMEWGTVFCLQTGEPLAFYDLHAYAQELFAAYEEHFASELATVTQ